MTRASLVIRAFAIATIFGAASTSGARAETGGGGDGCWYGWAHWCPAEGMWSYCLGLGYTGPAQAQNCTPCSANFCEDSYSISCCN